MPWLHEHEVSALACDNIGVEVLVPEDPEERVLPVHVGCLVDLGLPLGELWDLEALAADCAADGVYEFLLVAPPLQPARRDGVAAQPDRAEVGMALLTAADDDFHRGTERRRLVDRDGVVRGPGARARPVRVDLPAVPARARRHVVRHLRAGSPAREELWQLPYYRTWWHLPIPDGIEASSFELPNGLSYERLEPLTGPIGSATRTATPCAST